MRRILYRDAAGPAGSAGLLILRLSVGAAFLFHGWQKIQTPTRWMPPEAPVPGPLQAAAAVVEFGGGIGLILGLLTPLACLWIAGAGSRSTHACSAGAGSRRTRPSREPGAVVDGRPAPR